jgi:hypothetical protein
LWGMLTGRARPHFVHAHRKFGRRFEHGPRPDPQQYRECHRAIDRVCSRDHR